MPRLSVIEPQSRLSVSGERTGKKRSSGFLLRSSFTNPLRKTSNEIPTTFRGHSLRQQVDLVYQARKLSAVALDRDDGMLDDGNDVVAAPIGTYLLMYLLTILNLSVFVD